MDEGLLYVKKIVHFLNAIKMSRYTLSACESRRGLLNGRLISCASYFNFFFSLSSAFFIDLRLWTFDNNSQQLCLGHAFVVSLIILYIVSCCLVTTLQAFYMLYMRHTSIVCRLCSISLTMGSYFCRVISESASMSLLQFARMSLSVWLLWKNYKLDIETTFNCLTLIKKSLPLPSRITLNPKNKIINFIKRQSYSMSS